MPFKMMNPLKKMDTTAMKTVQKSAMKLKDLNNDGKTTKADLLIKKGVYNKDGSPVTLSSPAKKFTPIESVAGDIADMASSISGMLKNSSLFDKSSYIPLTKAERKAKEEKESNKTEAVKKKTAAAAEADNQAKDSIELTKAELLAKQKKLAEEKAKLLAAKATKKAASSSGKKTTYSQAWDKMTDAAKGKYKSKADFIKAAKAYNVKIGKTKNPTATIPKEKETVTTETETEKVTKANDISGNTGRNNSAADVLKRAKESAEKKKKEEEAKKKAAAEEAKKNKKLTPKEKRKAERNIKAQEKANKKIRGGGGTEIKVDKKNTTATASDRRKLKQGAKRLEQKLSLAKIELEGGKPKKKKEDKNGKDKKGKDKKGKGKGARNIIVPKQKREM